MRQRQVESGHQRCGIGRERQIGRDIDVRSRPVIQNRTCPRNEEVRQHVGAIDGGVGRVDLEFRPEQAAARRNKRRRVVVENARRVVEILAHVPQIETEVVLRGHGAAKGTKHARDVEDRLLKVTVGGLIVASVIVGAGFGVQQDRGDSGLHIAADTVTVVDECGGDALHVGRAGIALHQMLDQEFGDEWRHIRVIEDVVECVVEILQGGNPPCSM